MTLQEASRFLGQASIGTTLQEIEKVAKTGPGAWLDSQFATARATSCCDWLDARGYNADNFRFDKHNWERPLWSGLLTGHDPLRQRVTLALLDLFVVGIDDLNSWWRSYSLANYIDILADNAFGNFRELIENITYSTAMGSFLTYINSRKEDGQGRRPDENYAREIMQLFTIGLYELNEDGSRKHDGAGSSVSAYLQSDIEGLARVFTGLTYQSENRENPDRHRVRLRFDERYNETGTASFLGTEVSGGGEAAVSRALDTLFNHPNTGPFFCRRLIQSLVTSNPSPAYVGRISRVFADNGIGERGDLKGVIRAILLDPENAPSSTGQGGRLRDPIQRFLNWAIAFNVRDEADEWNMPALEGALAQSPGHSDTVFNFFAPTYSPPRTSISDAGLIAPEFQIATEQTVVMYVNFMHRAIAGYLGYFGLAADHSAYLGVAENPPELVATLNLVLAAGQVSGEKVEAIAKAVEEVRGSGDDQLVDRIRIATLLIMCSPDYLVLE